MKIGPVELKGRVIAAPMAGVTDRPFRKLCRRFGAAMAVSEMVSTNLDLVATRKTRLRLDHQGEIAPRVVQIVGSEPGQLAQAARYNVDRGAQIIDINMGCPAKKVCNKAAGSALLKDEDLVARILGAVVEAVDIPVTLKIRTGWNPDHRNGVRIAKIAEQSGIAALAVHGRTRACKFVGAVEYDTIRQIKSSVSIPVVANGDIDSPEKAREVLELTGADAVMVGRAAQGRPWIFQQIEHFLSSGEVSDEPTPRAKRDILVGHLEGLYAFYGNHLGVRIARKHVSWYLSDLSRGRPFRTQFNQVEDTARQLALVRSFFDQECGAF